MDWGSIFFTKVLGNTVGQYAFAVGVMCVALVVFALLQRRVLTSLERLAARTVNQIDDAVIAMVRSVKPPFYVVLSIYIGLKTLTLVPILHRVIDGIVLAIAIWYAMRALAVAIDMFVVTHAKDEGERDARRFLSAIVKAALWALAILLLLSNIGVNITSLVAGLGIGGVAIAFALQNILADLFSSFAIYFDKPFVVGDFIIVGEQMGTVEKIGIKTTRLRALQGEEIVIANQELTSSRIQNFKKMQERRIQMDFGIIYEIPRKKVAALPEKIRLAIEKDVDGVRIDRVHFAGFGESSLDFQLVYYVASGDYNEYMDRQQQINLSIMALFEKEKVAFAYPTRTLYNVSA